MLLASAVGPAAGAKGGAAGEAGPSARAGDPAVGWVVEVLPAEAGAPQEPLLRVCLDSSQPRVGVVFRHSVEKSPVVEWFEPAPPPAAGLVLVATEYESFGAGLPVDAPAGDRFRHAGDRFVIDGLAVPVPELVVRPLSWTEHGLLAGGVQHDLTRLADPGTPLLVRVVPVGTEPEGSCPGP